MKVDSKSAKMLVCAAAAAMGLTVSAATPIVKDGKAKVEADGYFDAVVPFRRLVGL